MAFSRQPDAYIEVCPQCHKQKVVGGGVGVLLKNDSVMAAGPCRECVAANALRPPKRVRRRVRLSEKRRM